MVVVDKKPFPEIYDIINSLNESRAWVFAEWVRVLDLNSLNQDLQVVSN